MDEQVRAARNRLEQEPSPYLRQHAANPVDWYPWSEEALERARRENKPILLSVGYSACHWCHVMAHESFENPQTAKLMNDLFVNIKVDREERPDLDQLYQGVVQLMGRGGGWPLTVFLTPDLRPFFGGTYFPPEDRFGMPGFPKLLSALDQAWRSQPKEIEDQARQFEEGLKHLGAYGLESNPAPLVAKDIVDAGEHLEQRVDGRFGGFGTAPKFPNPMNVAVLLRAYRRSGGNGLLSSALLTLERMAEGGIYDQLGGGFHRYSVDERWLVPHFEKMLYDNAQLLHLYAEAQQVSPRPLWKKVAEETVEYLLREMTAPGGGFFATQDADSEGHEGKFFVWTPEEMDQILPEPLQPLAKARFNVTQGGNFEGGATVLEVAGDRQQLAKDFEMPLEEVDQALSSARRMLFEAREKRIKPGRDEKILAGWNGLMIRGLALASRVFNREDWVKPARAAADFVLAGMWNGQRLLRAHQDGKNRIEGFVEDYGDFAAGLVALYQACFEARYLEAAEAIVDRAVELFWDEEKQAYRMAPRGQRDLLTVPFALHDNAFPSGASTLTEAQVALAAITGRPAHWEQAGKYLRKMRDEMARNPFAYGHLLLAADTWLDGAADVALVGSGEEVKPFLAVLNSVFAPTVAVSHRDPAVPAPVILEEAFRGRDPVQGKAAAYFCRSFSCQPPVTEPSALKRSLVP
jgi:uncharacterized protein YyaL (SSP411 family)